MRTPSMTMEDAEREIATEIGRRPIRVTADNRKHVKRWLAARGLPRLFVDGLSKLELQAAYNDANTGDGGFKALQKKLDDANDGEEEEADFSPSPPIANGEDEFVRTVAKLMSTRPTSPVIDEGRIRDIIREELGSLFSFTSEQLGKLKQRA